MILRHDILKDYVLATKVCIVINFESVVNSSDKQENFNSILVPAVG